MAGRARAAAQWVSAAGSDEHESPDVKMNLIAGCDPGLDGALAFLDPTSMRIVAMLGMPGMRLGKGKGSKREISPRTLVVMIEREIRRPVTQIFIECVSSSPQMGVSRAFHFGRSYRAIEGVVAALGRPVEYVTPQKWKKALNVPAEKDDARARACQLLPLDAELWTPRRGVMDQKQASGRAEAALIALYGARLNLEPYTEPAAARVVDVEKEDARLI